MGKNIKEIITKAIIKTAMDPEPREWPPGCTALVYQPVRPKKAENAQKK